MPHWFATYLTKIDDRGYMPGRDSKGRFQKGNVMSQEMRDKISAGMKGKNTWQAGRSHSEETKKKMSDGKKGKTPVWATQHGEGHWNWQGGITTENEKQRVRFKKYMRKSVLDRDDYTCQKCGVKGGDLQVDHIKSWAKHPELRFNEDNCRTLCTPCHYEITYNKKMPDTTEAWGHNRPRGVAS
jgi:5-methylcytosine-specific restriction endonuclease McrA